MSKKLKPCPFCGSENVRFADYPSKVKVPKSVMCFDCTASGPHAFQGSKKEAEEKWNERYGWNRRYENEISKSIQESEITKEV